MSKAHWRIKEGLEPELEPELYKKPKEYSKPVKEVRFSFSYYENKILICVLIIFMITFGGIIIVIYVLVIIIVIYEWIPSAIKQRRFLLLNVVAIIVDPLFFYYPVLNDVKKCIHLDKPVGITATVLRSVLDFLKLVCIVTELSHAYNLYKGGGRGILSRLNKFFSQLFKGKGRELLVNAAVRLWILFLIDILVILPIPQVLVIFGLTGTKYSNTMTFIVIQYVLRIIRTFFLFTQAIGASGKLADATLTIIGFNVLLYIQGGLVFGALWYYYAIEKANACWKKACINHIGCVHSSFFCDDSSGDYNFLNDSCPINTGNVTSYSFGIYNDALQFGIAQERNFPKKLLSSFKWGLQNLSAFGQNIQTSKDAEENIFAICITIIGVVLFVFLIGKMQSDTTKSQKINHNWKQIVQWPHFKDITVNIQRQIRKDKRDNWQNKRVKIDSLLSDLNEDTAREVKRQFGLKLLKKVKYFENWPESLLEYTCEFLKPVFFIERTHIIRKGEPIDEIIFVLEGKIWTYSYDSTANIPQKILNDGDFCGEELIAWATQNGSSSNLPISTRTYQACTNVEAFTLMAIDLNRLSAYGQVQRAALFVYDRWRYKRSMRAVMAEGLINRL